MRGWLSVKDITAALRFPSEDACRHWLRRAGIASVRRGRVILIDERDLDHALRHGLHSAGLAQPFTGNPVPAEGSR